MANWIAEFSRSLIYDDFCSFEKEYKKYYDSYDDLNYCYTAEEIYNEVSKYNNNAPMEKLSETLYENLNNGNFFSAMIAGMVSRNNLISNSSIDEDEFEDILDTLKIEDNVGAGQMVDIYNSFISTFINGSLDAVYISDLDFQLDQLRTKKYIDEEEFNRCQILIDNYEDFQKLINITVEFNNNCDEEIQGINFFDGNGNISTWEKSLADGSIYFNKYQLIEDLDNYYQSKLDERWDNFCQGWDWYWSGGLGELIFDMKNKDKAETVTAEITPVEAYSKYIETTNAISSKDIIKKLVAGTKNSANQASNTVYDPIILDLDGDGFNVETKENGVNFDLDKNGFAEKINWTTKDGFLCLDLNGNDRIYVNPHLA